MLTSVLLSLSGSEWHYFVSTLHFQEKGYQEPKENVYVIEIKVMWQTTLGRCTKRRGPGRQQPGFLLLILTSPVSSLGIFSPSVKAVGRLEQGWKQVVHRHFCVCFTMFLSSLPSPTPVLLNLFFLILHQIRITSKYWENPPNNTCCLGSLRKWGGMVAPDLLSVWHLPPVRSGITSFVTSPSHSTASQHQHLVPASTHHYIVLHREVLFCTHVPI